MRVHGHEVMTDDQRDALPGEDDLEKLRAAVDIAAELENPEEILAAARGEVDV